MKIKIFHKLTNDNINLITPVIYKNFIQLHRYPELQHNIKDIKDILNDKTFFGIFIFDEHKKILGYLIGKNINLNDGRKVFYISYIFVAEQFRNKKLGSKMLDIVHNQKKNVDMIMLTCDTYDKLVYNFYIKRGYMRDYFLRKFTRYDILSKPVL